MNVSPVMNSVNDAKVLVLKFDQIHKQLSAVRENNRQLENSLEITYKDLIRDPSLPDELKRHLLGDINEFTVFRLQKFEVALVLYSEFSEYTNLCNRLEQQHSIQIANDLSVISKSISSVKWFFTSSKQKENIKSAYYRLFTHLNDEYGTTITKAYTRIDQSIDYPKAHTAILDNPKSYQSMIKTLSNIVSSPSILGNDTVLLTQKRIVMKSMTAVSQYDKNLANLRHQIRSWIQNIAAEQTLKQLQKIEIDQLATVKTGLRTKLLRDYGFSTVDSVYSASTYQIASLNGISSETAAQIKDAAKTIADGISKSVKIRISADNRTQDATALVHFTYQFFKLQESKKKLHNYIQSVIKPASQAIEQLNSMPDMITYIFTKDNHRWREAYQYLASLSPDIDPVIQQVTTTQRYAVNEIWDDFIAQSIRYNTFWQQIAPDLFGSSDGEYGLPEELARQIQEQEFFPKGLKVQLRRYQEWGVKYALHQGKIILGDEMGLGKTVQAIATMVSLKNTGAKHFMVVCPASVLPNWCKEVEKKSVFHPTRIHGATRSLALSDWVQTGGVAITTYETTSQLRLPQGFHYDLLVVDEAHYIKNPKANRSKAVTALSKFAERVVFMTGTALENRVDEMITLVDILNHSVASSIQNVAYLSAAPVFRELVAPVYYRRKREDVLQELPEKEEMDTWIDLLPEEQRMYEQAVLSKNTTAIRRVSWAIGDPHHSAKALRLKEIVDEAADDGRRVIAFSFYKDTLRMLQHFLGSACAGMIDGSVPVEARQQMIDEFEAKPGGSVLLAQITAGGTGLNIQTASVVIICEPQLKPSIEDQAISRAYRMGQARKVLVYRLLASNTIDERITDLLEEKRKAFRAFADESAAANATNTSDLAIEDKTLGKLIQEEIDRINQANGNNTPSNDAMVAEDSPPVSVADSPTTAVAEVPLKAHISEAFTNTVTSRTSKQENPRYEDAAKKPAQSVEAETDKKILHDVTPWTNRPAQKSPAATNVSLPAFKQGENVISFSDVESFIRYMNDEEIAYVDKRANYGCLWVSSHASTDPMIKNVRINDHRFQYVVSAKAFNGKPGWFLS